MLRNKTVRTVFVAVLVSFFVLGTFSAALALPVNTGKLIEEDDTVKLLTGKGKFVLEGVDFSEHVGKVARVMGKVEEKDGIRTIHVQDYRIVSPGQP